MDEQALERLLLDRALGVLPPDTAALLEAYVAEHPGAASIGAKLEETAGLARAVIGGVEPGHMPAFPAARLARGWVHQQRVVLAWRVGGMAACLLAGLGVGAMLFRTAEPGAAPTVEFLVQSEPGTDVPAVEPDDFWSARRLYERASGVKPTRPAPRVIWESPLALPKVGDST